MPRGSKPGERRGGRKAGTPNKVTRDSRERFRKMAETVEHVLAEIAMNSEHDPARISAIKEIFDRAYGKAPQPLTDADGEGPPVIKIIKYDGD